MTYCEQCIYSGGENVPDSNNNLAVAPVEGGPSASATTDSPARLGRRLQAVLVVIIIADVLDLMDSTITNIAAPTIVHDIGGGVSLIKWLGASYALSLGVLLLVGGRLGDRYGARRIFLIGICGFTLASLGCGLSLNPTMLIAFRLIQGAFGALLIPQGLSILVASLSREQMPTAFAVFGPAMAGAAIAGPIVAGFIISANIAGLTWRPIFLINIMLGTFGFLAARKVLPEIPPSSDAPIDGLGAGLLGGGMLGLMYGLIEGSTDGWTLVPIVSMVAGGVLFGGFCLRQATEANPLIKPSLFKNRGFTSGLLLGLAYFAAVNGLFYVCSLFLQTGLGLSPSHAALGLGSSHGRAHDLVVCRPTLDPCAWTTTGLHRPGRHPHRRRRVMGHHHGPRHRRQRLATHPLALRHGSRHGHVLFHHLRLRHWRRRAR